MTSTPQGQYGVDAPYVLYALGGGAIAAALVVTIALVAFKSPLPDMAIMAFLLALSAASYLWTTRRGKFAVWAELLDALAMRGDERLLDVGCGRGAVLLLAAKRLPQAGRSGSISGRPRTNRETASARPCEMRCSRACRSASSCKQPT